MSEEAWTIVSKPVVANKWEDEEDEDVKDNWDDEEEEDDDASKSSSKSETAQPGGESAVPKPAVANKKKKQRALKEKILQKELEQQVKTKEELLADKLEAQRLQEESDLNLAKDAFGISSGSDASVLSTIRLASKNDFEDFEKALNEKLSPFVRSPHYVAFLEELFRNLSAGLEPDDIKKLDNVLTTLCNEKIKTQKQAKSKKTKKNTEIRMERDNDYSYDQYNEFEDLF